MELAKKISGKQVLIIVFANDTYWPVLENWLAAMRRINVNNYCVIALDEQLLSRLLAVDIPVLFRPCEPGLGKLWIHRIDVILEIMVEGYDVIHSDADAVWLQDPQPEFIDQQPYDMIFSQGTIWPPDVHEKWGFVLCCGFFYLKSNLQTLQFMKDLSQRVLEDRDDQISCNRMLLEAGVVWERPKMHYSLTFRQEHFVCSEQLISGQSRNLSIALLPHAMFQRIEEPEKEAYVKHIISEKNCDHIMVVLERIGCRFV